MQITISSLCHNNFTWAAQAMAQDNTIFCASGYNDNGFDAATFDSARVWRGEHFMALGWMVGRDSFAQVRSSKLTYNCQS